MSFSKQDSALRMREVVADIVRTVIRNERPQTIRATVTSYDPLANTAQVLQLGETESLTVTFNSTKQPIAIGEVVELAGEAGNRYISGRIAEPFYPEPLTGGGAVSWGVGVGNIGQLKWSQRFSVNVPSPQYAPDGFFSISMPPSGTSISSYRFVDSDIGFIWDTVTTTSTIPINIDQTLYYALPIGQDNSTVNSNFYLIDLTAPMTIPRHWVKIAYYNSDALTQACLSLQTGFGYDIDHWRIPVVQNGWHDYTANFVGIAYKKVASGEVIMRGFVAGGLLNSVICNLPEGYRPVGGDLVFPAPTSTGSAEQYGRIDVRTSGDLFMRGAGSVNGVSVSAIRFMPEA